MSVADKVFAFFVRSESSEGVVAFAKLTALGVRLQDVAVNLGNGNWRTKWGNIPFRISSQPQQVQTPSWTFSDKPRQGWTGWQDYARDVKRRADEFDEWYAKDSKARGYNVI